MGTTVTEKPERIRGVGGSSKLGLIIAWSRVPQLGGARHSLDNSVTVGRGDGCSWCLDDRTLSRAHFEVRPTPEGPLIRDLGSSNGTSLNGFPLQRECRLSPGAVIGAGGCVIVVVDDLDRLDDGPAPPDWGHAGDFYGRGVVDELRLAVASARPLLVRGARGVGKSLAVQALHRHWLTTGRLGQLLFCEGSSAVGVAEMAYCLEAARGGTLHVDWALELPVETQRFLIAEVLAKESDVKLVAESSWPPEGSHEHEGSSLLVPLIEATEQVTIPTLCDRRADIPSLFEHFLRRELDRESLISVLEELDTTKMARLCSHDYRQGNVFELLQVCAVIRARLEYDDDALTALRRAIEGLMIVLDEGETTLPATTVPAGARPSSTGAPVVYVRHREEIERAFEAVDGDVRRLEALLRARGFPIERAGLTEHLGRWGLRSRSVG